MREKSVLKQGFFAGLASFIFACVGVLVLAMLAQVFAFSQKVLNVANQAIKIAAIVLGVAIFAKAEKFVFKGVVAAVVFCLLSVVAQVVLGGTLGWPVALDLVVALCVAMLVAIIKSRKA